MQEAAHLALPFHDLLMTHDFLRSAAGQALSLASAVRVLEVSTQALAPLADADSPQGVLATVSLPRGGVETLPLRPGGLYVFADGLQDPGNLGALVRVAEAAGVAGLALAPGSAHPNHPRSLRASAGSLLRLPVAISVAAGELQRHLAGLEPRWVSLEPRGGRSHFDAELAGGTLVIAVGAEGQGLSAEARTLSSLALSIPLSPAVESLNATVAAALVLFEIVRQRRAPTPPSPRAAPR